MHLNNAEGMANSADLDQTVVCSKSTSFGQVYFLKMKVFNAINYALSSKDLDQAVSYQSLLGVTWPHE